ncbi:lipid-A-disaccharide synthase [Acinetobacter sp. c3-l95]|uniref:lipid-A-disaccharide synthase n=1 Tax=Acinetobacter sp. c3-l95 TaxID=3342804 RepID=UPI0035BA62D1
MLDHLDKAKRPLKIAIVVGEVSGDSLGVALMRSFHAQGIDAEFYGIGGSQMLQAGFRSLYPMESLSVMGLVEVLKHLKQLFAVRDGLIAHFKDNPPDIFIGIDAPDFNLRVAKQIKSLNQQHNLNIKTVQYVSPSVWAWRQKRVFNIKAVCDLVLCLFPFEVDFYQQYQVPAVFVGHPLAKSMPLQVESNPAKQQLNLAIEKDYIALLPGSRQGEVARLLPTLLDSVTAFLQHNPDSPYTFIIPAINARRLAQIEEIVNHHFEDKAQFKSAIQILSPQQQDAKIGRLAMQASRAVVLASGTATLECMLLHKPMIVIYKLHWLSYWLIKHMVKIPYVSLPNIIAKEQVVPELIQAQANPQNIAQHLQQMLGEQGQKQQEQLVALHQQLLQGDHMQDPALAVLQHFKL